MEKLEIIVVSLWCFVLLLVVLQAGYYAYLKITLIYMRILEEIQFRLGMFALRIRYFFSKKKGTPSDLKTQPFTENLTLYDLSNPVHPAPPTSAKPSCNPPKKLSKKKVSNARSERN
jgi:hypothetical protein